MGARSLYVAYALFPCGTPDFAHNQWPMADDDSRPTSMDTKRFMSLMDNDIKRFMSVDVRQNPNVYPHSAAEDLPSCGVRICCQNK